MHRTHRLRFRDWVAVLVTMAAVVGGCSSGTTMQNVWKDPKYTTGPVKKAVVFGIVQTSGSRRTLEDAFASALMAKGVEATPSYQLFPGDSVNKEEARAKLLAEGYDAVFVLKVTDKTQQTTYTGGTSYWGGYYGGWGGYNSGMTLTTEYVTFDNSVWDPSGEGKLIWSAITETLNPQSGPEFAASLIGALVPALARDGIVPSTPAKR